MDGMIQLDVLNAQTGHTTLTFDSKNIEEVHKASAQINDFLRLGYAIFVEDGGTTKRVTSFDSSKNCYMIGNVEAAPATAKATVSAPVSGGCTVQ